MVTDWVRDRMVPDWMRDSKPVECPIKCGRCCEDWPVVKAISPSYFKGYDTDFRNLDCPLLGPKGCKLPRKRRPAACTHFLCEKAFQKLQELSEGSCKRSSAGRGPRKQGLWPLSERSGQKRRKRPSRSW